jgi:DNA-directed RNA polymerase I, II, and III subunit RPABC2
MSRCEKLIEFKSFFCIIIEMSDVDGPTFPEATVPTENGESDNELAQSGNELEQSDNELGQSDDELDESDSELDESEPEDIELEPSPDEERGAATMKDPERGRRASKGDVESDIESDVESDTESGDESDDEEYLRKFDSLVRDRFIERVHPQALTHNYEEVTALAAVTRDARGQVIDALHRTTPVLTKYERTRVLGQRAAQINAGAKPLIEVPPGTLQGYLIAELELEAKKIPFILRRPLPNGGSEYWRVSDLELI